MFKNVVTSEGHPFRRFYELPLLRNESPALALSWTLHHVLDENSPLYGMSAEDLEAQDVSLVVVVSGYDVVRRKPSMRGNSMTISPFASGTAMSTFSALPRTDGSGSTTAVP